MNVSDANDGQALREFAAKGDNAPFAELVRRHSPMVLALCRRMLGNRQDAEDASQAVFLVLARKAESLAGEGSLAGWLYRVAFRMAQDACKARGRRQAREEQAAMIMSEEPAASGGDPEQLSALREALAGLPEKYRLPIVLHHLEGKSYEAAAELAGCKPKAFSVRLARGREMLRNRLARRGVACALPMLVGWLAEEAVAEEVSETFIVATAKMACGWVGAGGTMAAGAAVVPAHVAELAKGVLNMMFWNGVKMAALVTVAAIAVSVAGVTVVAAVAKEPVKSEAHAESQKPVAVASGNTAVDGAGKQDAIAGGAIVRNLQLVLSVDQVEGGLEKPRFSVDTIECVSGMPLRISFAVAVVNRGTEPLKIMNTGCRLRLVAPDGREIEEIRNHPFARGSVTAPTAENVKELAPGEKVKYTENLHARWDPEDKVHPGKALNFYAGGGIAWDISKPGKYRIIAKYRPTEDARRIGRESKLDIWDGEMESNPIMFTVKAADTDSAPPPAKPDAAAVKALAKGNNEFAWDMYGKLKADKGNLFFSPFSLRTALAMTYAGARGETAAQMEKALRFAPQDPALHSAIAATIASIEPGEKGGYTFTVANSLWGQKDYGFLKPFLETCKANYGSGLTEVDFIKAFEEARGKINLWVEDKTNQKIKDLIPSGGLNELTRLVLVNAVWFKGDWLNQFKKGETKDAPFYLDATEKVTAPLMHRLGGGYRYAEADGIQILEMPYKGEKLAMVVLLPKGKDWIGKLEAMLTAEKIAAWAGSLHVQEKVDVYLPKFKVAYGTKEMTDPFKAMGMVLPFKEGAADFSGMNGIPPPEALFISKIFHKAFVEVNEEGTEAAAATAVVVTERGAPPAPPVFRADHPFVFLIRDKANGNILFLGRMVNPKG